MLYTDLLVESLSKRQYTINYILYNYENQVLHTNVRLLPKEKE